MTRNIERLIGFFREVLQAEAHWNGPYAEFPTRWLAASPRCWTNRAGLLAWRQEHVDRAIALVQERLRLR